MTAGNPELQQQSNTPSTRETADNQFVVGKTEKLIALANSQGEPITGYSKTNAFNRKISSYGDEFPHRGPFYKQQGPRGIVPADHELKPIKMEEDQKNISTADFFVQSPGSHFIRDVPQGLGGENNTEFVNPDEEVVRNGYLGVRGKFSDVTVFSGATTNINPTNDSDKKEMSDNGGLSTYIEKTHKDKELGTYLKPPISPIHPFTRLGDEDNPYVANEAIFKSYNRTKLPIADLEWRKGFRHIFITRPECYIMAHEGDESGSTLNAVLSNQAMNDEDFNSAYTRMPHILKLLSPWYVTGSFLDNAVESNWNFLLSNRVQGMSVAATSMSINENVAKSIEGYTVIPAMHLETRQGSTLDLTFRDTRNLDVYETARLWMLYMYKRKKGIFFPPYNGYKKENGFVQEKHLNGYDYTRFHPYDRALEYCASLYDIVTNETGTKILYWCKYYGIYPTQVTPTLNNENNSAITDMTCSITFKYHYRLENRNNVLVEFNHDAGLTNDIGKVKSDKITNSLPFLLRNSYDDPVMKRYIGASGMFTGSPYIVMARSQPDPLDKSNIIVVPNLRFMNIGDLTLDGHVNAGITNTKIDQDTINLVAYE